MTSAGKCTCTQFEFDWLTYLRALNQMTFDWLTYLRALNQMTHPPRTRTLT